MGDENMTAQEQVEVADAAEELAVEEVSQNTDALEAKEEIVESAPTNASEGEEENPDEYPKVYAENLFGKCHKKIDQAWEWVKKKLHLPTLTKKEKALIWDKFTTGLLIFLFCTPFLVLLYILLWFLLK